MMATDGGQVTRWQKVQNCGRWAARGAANAWSGRMCGESGPKVLWYFSGTVIAVANSVVLSHDKIGVRIGLNGVALLKSLIDNHIEQGKLIDKLPSTRKWWCGIKPNSYRWTNTIASSVFLAGYVVAAFYLQFCEGESKQGLRQDMETGLAFVSAALPLLFTLITVIAVGYGQRKHKVKVGPGPASYTDVATSAGAAAGAGAGHLIEEIDARSLQSKARALRVLMARLKASPDIMRALASDPAVVGILKDHDLTSGSDSSASPLQITPRK